MCASDRAVYVVTDGLVWGEAGGGMFLTTARLHLSMNVPKTHKQPLKALSNFKGIILYNNVYIFVYIPFTYCTASIITETNICKHLISLKHFLLITDFHRPKCIYTLITQGN